MASEQSNITMNGNYIPHQQTYGNEPNFAASHSTNNSISADYAAAAVSGNASSAAGNNADIPKDEVGWYFVEQYYTTLSRNPEKLYLFYNRKSQFVSGNETEKISVSVGQKAINDRIQELDIKDCKVRVTNVDSQGSGSNIVIQVIGELSNKSQSPRKFTQTFVLAEQSNGYYVLNDIFRYIMEEDEEEMEGEQSQSTASVLQVDSTVTATGSTEPMKHAMTSSDDPAATDRDAAIVDASLNKAIDKEPDLTVPASSAETNGAAKPSSTVTHAEDAPVAVPSIEEPTTASATIETIKNEEIVQPEKPKDPEPTPAAPTPEPVQKSQPPPPAAAAAPIKPALPKTWANMVASNRQAAPQASSTAPAASTSPAATTTANAPPTAPAAAKPTPPAQIVTSTTPAGSDSAVLAQDSDQVGTPQSSGSEWQTAGQDHGKKQPRPQSQQPAPADNSRAYIKNIGENIEAAALRAVLTKAGEVTYLDINRQKNCAFVDFASPAAYQAAVKANPHEVAGEQVYVEERRVRPQSFAGGYNNRGGAGVGGGRGRGGKDGGRGNFSGRSRGAGAGGNARGRGAPQAA